MAVPPLPDPVPGHLPPGFVGFPDRAMDATSSVLSTGPVSPVRGPRTTRMRRYVPAPPSMEALQDGPSVVVMVDHASSFPPEWFEGLTGAPVDISGSDGYYRASSGQISLIVLHDPWVIEVITGGVSEAETLAVARSLDLS